MPISTVKSTFKLKITIWSMKNDIPNVISHISIEEELKLKTNIEIPHMHAPSQPATKIVPVNLKRGRFFSAASIAFSVISSVNTIPDRKNEIKTFNGYISNEDAIAIIPALSKKFLVSLYKSTSSVALKKKPATNNCPTTEEAHMIILIALGIFISG